MRRLLATLALLLAGSTADAQSQLLELRGANYNEQFGRAARVIGDVDGDGTPDFAVGSHTDSTNGYRSGAARIYSGASGALLYSYLGEAEENLGRSVAGLGDLNGDGHAEFAIGAPSLLLFGFSRCHVYIYSGADGSLYRVIEGYQPADRFGTVMANVGDVNKDGTPDLMVGAPGFEGAFQNSGLAAVYSGADGQVISRVLGNSETGSIARSVAGCGDLDNDGHADYAISGVAVGISEGALWVYSGASGHLMRRLISPPTTNTGCFGFASHAAGDVDGDGTGDLLVGNSGHNSYSGVAYIFSMADGSVLHTFEPGIPNEAFGAAISAGDINGDGVLDYVVGAPGSGTNRVACYSGIDRQLLWTESRTSDLQFAAGLDATADVNGDERADVLVASPPPNQSFPLDDVGRVFLLSGCDAQGSTYCTAGQVNSTGSVSHLTACGDPKANGHYFQLEADHLPSGQFGAMLLSRTSSSIPMFAGGQGTLCLGNPIGRVKGPNETSIFTWPGKQSVLLSVDLQQLPSAAGAPVAVPGETLRFQFWYRDVNPLATSNLSDALEFLVR